LTNATETYTEREFSIASGKLRVLTGGDSGNEAVVVLHHSTGNPGWLPFHQSLADRFRVYVPDMPGYGQSERPEWAREPRDLAVLMNQTFEAQNPEGGVHLVGLGFGGFVAAEMATMNQSMLKSLTLVGAAGTQPREGEILDQMMVDYPEYVQAGFRDEGAYNKVFGEEGADNMKELWDFSREMTARLTWKPYMFNRRLVPLMAGVQTKTLLIWGENDAVIPLDCAKQFQESLPISELKVVPGAGHLVELEDPSGTADLIAAHIAVAAH
jgi:pimeloyl-ACP methyl ester carboxylesterase